MAKYILENATVNGQDAQRKTQNVREGIRLADGVLDFGSFSIFAGHQQSEDGNLTVTLTLRPA